LDFNQRGLDLATKIAHPRYQIRGLMKRALIESTLGQYHKSIGHLREAQKLARLVGRIHEECSSLSDEAIPLCRLGHFTEAQECAEKSYELLVKNGLQGSDVELSFFDRMAEIHLQKTEYAEARQFTELIVKRTSRHRSPYFHANALRTLVQFDIIMGMDEAAIIPLLAASRELSTQLSWPHSLILCDILQCELDLRRGERLSAYPMLKDLASRADSDAEVVYLSLEILGELSNKLCGLEETARWAATYFAFASKTNDIGHTYQALRYLGDIFLAQGDEDTALNVFQAVLDGSTEMNINRRRADCMSRIGDIILRRGDADQAKLTWEAARPLFARSSRATDVMGIDSKLAQLYRRDSEAASEISGPGIFTQTDVAVGIAPVEVLESEEDAATEIPVELLNLRAPTGLPVAEPEVGEIVVTSGENEKVVMSA
jgi:tetratricopeptide (TPR) repeat protein